MMSSKSVSIPNRSYARQANSGKITMGVDLHQKVGGPNRKIIGSKNLCFLKPSKTAKVQILGVLVVFICPAIYSTNQI